MMVVRSRLQLTLAILKPDLMMHTVRTKVRKVLVRFLHCPIHLFMRQSHIISHKIEWASKVETYITLMWWACAKILPLLTPETFSCLVPDTPYTSLFLPQIYLCLLTPHNSPSFTPLHSRPTYTPPFFSLPQRPFPILFQTHLTLPSSYPRCTSATSAFLPQIHLPLYLLWQISNCFHDRKWRRS